MTLASDTAVEQIAGVLDLPGGPLDVSRHVAVVAAGAEIVDVGGVEFAPGPPVPVEDEIARV